MKSRWQLWLTGACFYAACAPAVPSSPTKKPQAQATIATKSHADASIAAQLEARDASPPSASDPAAIIDAGPGRCWTVGRAADRGETILGQQIVVVGYGRNRQSTRTELADSRSDTEMALPVVGTLPDCNGLVKSIGRLVDDRSTCPPGTPFCGAEDGLGFHLEGSGSACADRDDCIGPNEQEDGGRPACALGKYNGPIRPIVSLKELVSNPQIYNDRDIVVDAPVWSPGIVSYLRVTEQRGGESVVSEVLLDTTDRELRRRIRACDRVVLRVLAHVHAGWASAFVPAVRLHVARVGRP